MDIILIVELVLFVVLLGFSGFFSGSETALFSLNQSKLEQMEQDRNPQVGLIKRLLNEPRRLIVTILIGNELVNVSASVLSASIIITLMGNEDKWWVNIFIMLPLLLLLGEITPKTIAMKSSVTFATWVSPLLELFAKLITPIRVVVRFVADKVTTMLIGKERGKGNIVTKDMVRTLAEVAKEEGEMDHTERQFINNIFDFGNQAIWELMTPRSNMLSLSIDEPLQNIMAKLQTTPFYRSHVDNIVGILHVRDLMDPTVDLTNFSMENLTGLLREPMMVPATQSVTEMFFRFRKCRCSFALILDEFGGITGLITMDDLLGAIFGSLRPVPKVKREDLLDEHGNPFLCLQGDTPVAWFNLTMQENLPTDIAETLGGLLLHQLGELPKQGAEISMDVWSFTITKVAGNRITTIECCRKTNDKQESSEKKGG